MTARRLLDTKTRQAKLGAETDTTITNDLLDELESLLPADNPAVMKRKALRDLPTKVTSPNVPR